MDKIKGKIVLLEKYLEEWSEIAPATFENYVDNLMIKAAAERYFEKIVECITDVAFLTLKKQGVKSPDDDTAVFTRLVESNVIESSLAESLRKAKSMRNRIAHQYSDLDDNILFDALQNQLLNDAKEFIKQIKTTLGD